MTAAGHEPPFESSWDGHCPVCDRKTKFTSSNSWYRDFLLCGNCGSIPRERALALTARNLGLFQTGQLVVHKISPSNRAIDRWLEQQAGTYYASHFFADVPRGEMRGPYRSEDLEQMTFEDRSIDLHVSLDVMEHVFRPDLVFSEVRRTLKDGGIYLFTAPTYKHLVESVCRATLEDGKVNHLLEPEYHGNPISADGSLVTFHYGYDLPELIRRWADLDTAVLRFNDRRHGVVGEFTEVYVVTKNPA